MSYQWIEATLVSGTVLAAVLYAMSRWWPARLQPIKRWRREAAAGCGSGCGGCSSQGGGCGTPSRTEGGVQRVAMPASRRTAR